MAAHRCKNLLNTHRIRFTVSHDATFMFRHTFSEVFRLSLKAEKADFEKGLAWLRDVIQGSIFSAERCVLLIIGAV